MHLHISDMLGELTQRSLAKSVTGFKEGGLLCSKGKGAEIGRGEGYAVKNKGKKGMGESAAEINS